MSDCSPSIFHDGPKPVRSVEDQGRADHEQLRKAGISVAVIPKDGFLGIADDYDSHIPASTTFTIAELVTKLNKERVSWDTEKSYKATLLLEWRWQIDFVPNAAVVPHLYRGNIKLGLLEFPLEEPWTAFIVSGFTPFSDCTIGDVAFIRECTGWDIQI